MHGAVAGVIDVVSVVVAVAAVATAAGHELGAHSNIQKQIGVVVGGYTTCKRRSNKSPSSLGIAGFDRACAPTTWQSGACTCPTMLSLPMCI